MPLLEDVPLGERTQAQNAPSRSATAGTPGEVAAGVTGIHWTDSYFGPNVRKWGGDLVSAQSPLAGLAGSVGTAGSINRQEVLDPAPEGSYRTYRTMRRHPTVALARAVVFAPVLGAEWAVTPRDDQTPPEWVDYVRDNLRGFWRHVTGQALRALDYGWRGFEQVWEIRQWRGRPVAYLAKLKPLRPEATEITRNARGNFTGFKQERRVLQVERCLLYSHDMDEDDYYGNSRHENIREHAWWPWIMAQEHALRLGYKVSSMVPVVKGPVSAVERTPEGNEVRGIQAAQAIVIGLATGRGVFMDNLIDGAADLEAAADLAKASRWHVEMLETGGAGTGSSAAAIQDSLRYLDSLIMRGWLRPERAALEGQFGTKAEAETHRDVGLGESEMLADWIAEGFNWHTVDRALAWTFAEQVDENGEEYARGVGGGLIPVRGSVRVEPQPIIDRRLEMYHWVVGLLLQNPAVLDLLATTLDLNAMATELGLPIIPGRGLDYNPPAADDDAFLPPEDAPALPE